MVSKEWTKFWRAAGFEDLELLRATYILTRWFKRIVGVAPGGFLKVAG